jgi:hypothetical protein
VRECFCGCGKRHGLKLHHVVYQQHIGVALRGDSRNMVPVAAGCHAKHHSRQAPYELRLLPDSAFEFALEVLGPGPAYEYLRRRYAGEDGRLEALLSKEAV